MKPLKAYTRTGIVFVIITGSIAHFLYDWSDHALIVGLFTPVNVNCTLCQGQIF